MKRKERAILAGKKDIGRGLELRCRVECSRREEKLSVASLEGLWLGIILWKTW